MKLNQNIGLTQLYRQTLFRISRNDETLRDFLLAADTTSMILSDKSLSTRSVRMRLLSQPKQSGRSGCTQANAD